MDEHQQRAFNSWAKFLNPQVLRQNLITASLFLAAFESLKSSVTNPIRDFFSNGFDENGFIVDPEYQAEVLDRHKSPLRASLLWLHDREIVDDADIATVDRIREHRNELAHQLMKYVAQSESEIDVELIGEISKLVTKIDRWWILEVEVPANSDYDGQEIDESEIISGNMFFLQMMMQVAAGDDSSDETYVAFMEAAAKRGFEPADRA
ncbi:MAG: hypothetical protein GXP24_08705 [Planctomycetes bacterium]|nr:hypothetical protein [Planctomycetota bacterium]